MVAPAPLPHTRWALLGEIRKDSVVCRIRECTVGPNFLPTGTHGRELTEELVHSLAAISAARSRLVLEESQGHVHRCYLDSGGAASLSHIELLRVVLIPLVSLLTTAHTFTHVCPLSSTATSRKIVSYA